MFFQPLSAENGTFFQPEVEFIYKIPAFKETPKQQNSIFTNVIVLEKQTDDEKR